MFEAAQSALELLNQGKTLFAASVPCRLTVEIDGHAHHIDFDAAGELEPTATRAAAEIPASVAGVPKLAAR